MNREEHFLPEDQAAIEDDALRVQEQLKSDMLHRRLYDPTAIPDVYSWMKSNHPDLGEPDFDAKGVSGYSGRELGLDMTAAHYDAVDSWERALSMENPEDQADSFAFWEQLSHTDLQMLADLAPDPTIFREVSRELREVASGEAALQSWTVDYEARVQERVDEEMARRKTWTGVADAGWDILAWLSPFAHDTEGTNPLADQTAPLTEKEMEKIREEVRDEMFLSPAEREMEQVFEGIEDLDPMDPNYRYQIGGVYEWLNRNNLWDAYQQFADGMSVRTGETHDMLVAFKDMYMSEVLAGIQQKLDEPPKPGIIMNTLGFLAGELDNLYDAIEVDLTGTEYDRPTIREQEIEEQRAWLEQQRDVARALPRSYQRDVLRRNATMADTVSLWDDLDQDDQQTKINFIKQAGGTEEMYMAGLVPDDIMQRAFGFFDSAIQTMVNEQTDPQEWNDILDAQLQAEDDYIRQLGENDFTLGSQTLEVIALYGTHVVGKTASFGVLAAQEDDVALTDFFSFLAQEGEFEEYMTELEGHNYMPSVQAGYEGTFTGLAIDFFGGLIADPLTWIYGPAGRGVITSTSAVDDVLRRGVAKQYLDEVAIFGEKGQMGQTIMSTAWMGHYGEDVLRLARDGASRDVIRSSLEKASKSAMLAGYTPDFATRFAAARQYGRWVRSLANSTDEKMLNGRLGLMMQQRGTRRRYSVEGATARRDMLEMTNVLWADNPQQANFWMETINDIFTQDAGRQAWWRGRASLVDSEIQTIERIRSSLTRQTGPHGSFVRSLASGTDPAFGQLGDEIAGLVTGSRDYDDLARALDDRLSQLRVQKNNVDHLSFSSPGDMDRGADLQKAIDRMFDEFNREHIASNPVFKELVDPDTGLVPWNEVSTIGLDTLPGQILSADDGVRQLATEAQERAFKKKAAKAEQDIKRLTEAGEQVPDELRAIIRATRQDSVGGTLDAVGSILANRTMNVTLPASPMYAAIASSVTRSGSLKAIRKFAVTSAIKDTLHTANRLWMSAVVLSPRTAAVVAVDELMRIFHVYGMRGVREWTRQFARRQKGMRKAGKQLIEDDVPKTFLQAERSVYEQSGLGWHDISYGDPGHRAAVTQAAHGVMQDSGFRAYLKGYDDFIDWLRTTPEGQKAQAGAPKIVERGRPPRTMTGQEMYEMWDFLAKEVFFTRASKNGVLDDLFTDLREAAEGIESFAARKASGQAVDPVAIPDSLFEAYDSVRGVLTNPQGGVDSVAQMGGLANKGFDFLFQGPMTSRRSVVANLEREYERQRLHQLFASNGMRKMSIDDAARMLDLEDYVGASASELRDWINQEALRRGIVTYDHIENLVEQRAIDQINNMMYAWDSASLGGRTARSIMPFAGPWADMWGFWGRQLVSRGRVRSPNEYLGRITNGRLGSTIAPEASPVGRAFRGALETGLGTGINPRTAGFFSRMAALDLDLENAGGFEETGGIDFSPISFLPTSGQNALATMIPGVGPLPLALIDQYLASIDDPVEFDRIRDEISQFVPFAAYSRGTDFTERALNRYWGGTIFQRAAEVGGAALRVGESYEREWRGMAPEPNLAGMIGQGLFNDPSAQTQVIRSMQAYLWENSDQWLDQLKAAESPEDFDELWLSILGEVTRTVDAGEVKSGIFSWLVPANTSTSFAPSLGIAEGWLEVGRANPDIFGAIEDHLSDDDTQFFGDSVRTAYFKLPTRTRERLALQHPELVAMVVPTWRWTDKAKNDPRLDTVEDYDFINTDEGIIEHNQYILDGLITHVPAKEWLQDVLGTVTGTRKQVAVNTLFDVATTISDLKWGGEEALLAEFGYDIEELRALTALTETQIIKKLGVTEVEAEALVDEFNQFDPFFPVSDETKTILSDAVELMQGLGYNFGTMSDEDAQKFLWRNIEWWRDDMRDSLVEEFAEEVGLTPDAVREKYGDDLQNLVNKLTRIPTSERAWSESAMSSLTSRDTRWDLLSAQTLNLLSGTSEDLALDIEAMGLSLGEANGPDFYNQVQSWQRDIDAGGLYGRAVSTVTSRRSLRTPMQGDFDQLFNDRLVLGEAFDDLQGMREQFERQDQIFRVQRDLVGRSGVTATEKKEMRDTFLNMRQVVGEDALPWDELWESSYRKMYGDLRWELPEPPTIFTEDGQFTYPNTYSPDQFWVIDGDSMEVSNRVGSLEAALTDQPSGGYEVRLYTVAAADYGVAGEAEQARLDEQRLRNWLDEARRGEMRIYFVPASDVHNTARTDRFGREFVYLFRDDEVYTDGIEGWMPFGTSEDDE